MTRLSLIEYKQKLISILSFSGHVPPSTKTKDNEHIQRLKSLGLADEDIQVSKTNNLFIEIFSSLLAFDVEITIECI
jgi:hypothetical protein